MGCVHRKMNCVKEVALSVLMKIADVMNCNAGDMMGFFKDDERTKKLSKTAELIRFMDNASFVVSMEEVRKLKNYE